MKLCSKILERAATFNMRKNWAKNWSTHWNIETLLLSNTFNLEFFNMLNSHCIIMCPWRAVAYLWFPGPGVKMFLGSNNKKNSSVSQNFNLNANMILFDTYAVPSSFCQPFSVLRFPLVAPSIGVNAMK